MRHRNVLCTAVVGAIILSAGPVSAQDESASENATVEKLKKAVEQRDAVIRDLLRRVERLERSEQDRRVAVEKPTTPPNGRQTSKLSGQTIGRSDELATVVGGASDRSDVIDTPGRTSIAQAPSPPSSVQGPAATPPQSGPGQFEVSPEAAEHALERALVQTGASLLPPWKAEIVPSLTYQYRELSRPGQIALSSSGSVLVTEDIIRNTSVQAGLLGRLGLPWDFQIKVGPLHLQEFHDLWPRTGSGISERSIDANGFGDPTVNLIKQVLTEGEWIPSLFLNGAWNANFGQTSHGIPLGQGFHEFAFGATAVKRQDPLVFTAGLSYPEGIEEQ